MDDELRERLEKVVSECIPFDAACDSAGIHNKTFAKPVVSAILADLSAQGLAIVEEGLIGDLCDPGECWYDHHGFCQAHGWMATDPICPHARGKTALKATEPKDSER